jgi:hypothetical protein
MRFRAFVFTGFAALLIAAPAQAATFTVNTTADPVGASGCTAVLCTVRTAIAAAAANGNATDDVVAIPAGTYTLTTSLGALNVPASATRITISGAGANATFLQSSAASGIRVLSVGGNAGVALSDLTLRSGNVTSGTGGNLLVSSMASVTLTSVRVTGGTAPRGGGIATAGAAALSISQSLIDTNVATATSNSDLGGGLYVEGQTTATAVTIQDSTFTANRAQQGGAIGVVNNTGQNPILRGATIARNTARGNPGIAGVYSVNTTARFQGSILSENTYNFVTGSGTIPVTTNCALASAAIDDGGNLESATDCGLAGHQSTDPLLAAALDGSQPPVLAIPANSPAVDIAACGTRTQDQRGVARPQGATCDAGAYERDSIPPNTTITAGPTGPTNDNTPTFSFTSEAGATFECRVDAAAFASCGSPFTTAALSAGGHTFEVRAIDAALNPDPSPASRAFVVDTTAPDTTITGNPPASTSDNTPTFTFTSTEAGTFQCRVDAAAFAVCTSPFTTAPLTQGSHTFEVRAIDAAGNVDGAPATHAFTMDATPPDTALAGSDPTEPSTDPSAVFTFSSPEPGASFECSLDSSAFAPCTSPKSYSSLPVGPHMFAVRAVDALGNVDASPATRSFTIVSPSPVVTLPQQQPTPTPTPAPTPVAGQSVGMKPISGKVLVKLPGSSKFVPLDPSVIKNGAEVDTREGVVEITRSDGGVAKFYDGIFKLSQSGGITTLTLSEKLTGCPSSKKQRASAAAKKPKARKLWGDGKGKFRTRGQYSAATIRGTRWLVQDTCTSTLTRVVRGVVAVNDFALKKTVLVKQGKRYTARPKRR